MIETVDPKFLTATVIGVCNSMRMENEYSALPILADALQDADCDNEDLLAHLRHFSGDAVAAQRITCLVMGGKWAEAVRWVERYAESIGGSEWSDYHSREMTYERLIVGAADWVVNGNRILGGSELEGEYVPEDFWSHYEAIIGRAVDENSRTNFFSCSC